MIVRRPLSRSISCVTVALVALFSTEAAVAAPIGGGAGGMPWESSFSKILDSIQSVAPVLATIAFIIAGAALMFGEGGGMSRKAVGLVVGGAIVFGVAPLITTLFQGSAGVLF